jgi:hypothetical protein
MEREFPVAGVKPRADDKADLVETARSTQGRAER